MFLHFCLHHAEEGAERPMGSYSTTDLWEPVSSTQRDGYLSGTDAWHISGTTFTASPPDREGRLVLLSLTLCLTLKQLKGFIYSTQTSAHVHNFHSVLLMKFQQRYQGLSMHIQLWLTHSSWESRKKKTHAWQFSLLFTLNTLTDSSACLHQCDWRWMQKRLYSYARSHHYKNTAHFLCDEREDNLADL